MLSSSPPSFQGLPSPTVDYSYLSNQILGTFPRMARNKVCKEKWPLCVVSSLLQLPGWPGSPEQIPSPLPPPVVALRGSFGGKK